MLRGLVGPWGRLALGLSASLPSTTQGAGGTSGYVGVWRMPMVSSGQNRSQARPMISSTATTPNVRESTECSRLSPITSTFPLEDDAAALGANLDVTQLDGGATVRVCEHTGHARFDADGVDQNASCYEAAGGAVRILSYDGGHELSVDIDAAVEKELEKSERRAHDGERQRHRDRDRNSEHRGGHHRHCDRDRDGRDDRYERRRDRDDAPAGPLHQHLLDGELGEVQKPLEVRRDK